MAPKENLKLIHRHNDVISLALALVLLFQPFKFQILFRKLEIFFSETNLRLKGQMAKCQVLDYNFGFNNVAKLDLLTKQ